MLIYEVKITPHSFNLNLLVNENIFYDYFLDVFSSLWIISLDIFLRLGSSWKDETRMVDYSCMVSTVGIFADKQMEEICELVQVVA